jgi:predicted phosphodiesterase
MAAHQTPKRARSPSPQPDVPSKRSRIELSSTSTVKFLIVSDTHDTEPNLPQCDVLLHCGDLTEDGSPASLKKALKAIGKANAGLKLVIAGNHEISLDKSYYLSEGGSEKDYAEAYALVSSDEGSEASKNGVTFLEEGTHTFTLKSGVTFTIYASPYTPKYGASAFQYQSDEDRFNIATSTPKWAKNVGTEKSVIPMDVDVVMTHGPPKYLLDATADGRSAGCEHLRRALARVRPRLHCFGHIHRGYGAQRIEYDDMKTPEDDPDCIISLPKEWVGKNQAKRKGYANLPPNSREAFHEDKGQTLMVNAAVLDKNDEPGNAPWMVELELPVSRRSLEKEEGEEREEGEEGVKI